MALVSDALEQYAWAHTSAPPPPLEELERETHRTMKSSQMLTGRVEGRLLKLLVQMIGARRVLELGTFTGYGTLSMAEGLPEDGRIYTCEIKPESIRFAEAYFARSPHGRKITILQGDDLPNIRRLEPPFDFIFVDGDKRRYLTYFEEGMRLLRPGGVMAVDNVLWSGRVLDPTDEDSRAIDGLNRVLARDDRVEAVCLTVRDGVQLVRKK